MSFVLLSELLAKHVCSASYVNAGFHSGLEAKMYEVCLISNAHNEIFYLKSIVAMSAQWIFVATTLLHSSAKFYSFLYSGSKTVRVNMESCYGGMLTR